MQFDKRLHDRAESVVIAIDFSGAIASLVATQAASMTAAAQRHHELFREMAGCREQAMVGLMQGQPGWKAAARTLGGSFHPGVAPMIVANLS